MNNIDLFVVEKTANGEHVSFDKIFKTCEALDVLSKFQKRRRRQLLGDCTELRAVMFQKDSCGFVVFDN